MFSSHKDKFDKSVSEMSGLCFSRLRIRPHKLTSESNPNRPDKIGKTKARNPTESEQFFVPFQAYN